MKKEYVVEVLGSDGIFLFDSEIEALKKANEMNKIYVYARKIAKHRNDPILTAVVKISGTKSFADALNDNYAGIV